jgi:hypothetical protein
MVIVEPPRVHSADTSADVGDTTVVYPHFHRCLNRGPNPILARPTLSSVLSVVVGHGQGYIPHPNRYQLHQDQALGMSAAQISMPPRKTESGGASVLTLTAGMMVILEPIGITKTEKTEDHVVMEREIGRQSW